MTCGAGQKFFKISINIFSINFQSFRAMVNPINPLTSFFVSFLLLIALSFSMTLELSAQFTGGQGKGDDRQSDGVALATLGSFTLAELMTTTDETTARFAVVVSADGWESFVRRGVCIGTGIVPSVLDTCFDADSSGTDSYEVLVEGLAPSTDYTARAFAISLLEITYSASVSFTTPQPPTVVTQGVALVESRMAVVTGAVTDEGSGAVVQQGVCYGQSEKPTTADTCVQAASLEASFEVELDGLLPGTVYFVRAFAQHSEATGYGNQLVFSTLPEQGAVTDIDGKVYSTVIIGEQEWMAENLNAGRYAGGGTIPEVTGAIGWTQLDTPAWSWYGNESANGETYGKLYNGFAVAGEGNLCPDGWSVPTESDWQVLERLQAIFEDELGNTGLRGVSQASGGRLKATGTSLWSSPNSGASNTSGWSALPGGFPGVFGNQHGAGNTSRILDVERIVGRVDVGTAPSSRFGRDRAAGVGHEPRVFDSVYARGSGAWPCGGDHESADLGDSNVGGAWRNACFVRFYGGDGSGALLWNRGKSRPGFGRNLHRR